MQEQNIQNCIFSERLRALMEKTGVKQIPLAEGINVHQPKVSRWLDGQMPSVEDLLKVAEFFQVSLESLVGKADLPTHLEMRELASEVQRWKKRAEAAEEKLKKIRKLTDIDPDLTKEP